jgi:hypothetical protein
VVKISNSSDHTPSSDKYAPVVYTAMLQHYQRCNKMKVNFLAAALSHSREISSGLFDLVEWITGHRKRAAHKGDQ